MKVHRVVFTVIDFDELGADGVVATLESQKFPNHCMNPVVRLIETRDIGEWSDDHLLNSSLTDSAELARLFSEPQP